MQETNVDGVGRWHETTIICDTSSETMPKEQLPIGLRVRCQSNGWTTNELIRDWLQVVRNRRPGVLLRK
jgi:hypothetical protein